MSWKIKQRAVTALLLCSAIVSGWQMAQAAAPWQSASTATGQLQITVTDQNGQPLPMVIVIAQQDDKVVAQERTTPSGNAVLRQLAPGTYKVLVEKQGFYTTAVPKLEIGAGQPVPIEVKLQPVREYKEEIEVTAQPSPIDPQETSSAQAITASDISSIPYPTTRDYRGVLAYIPGVVGDRGQIHIAGASTQEIQDYLDGFEVSQPASGALSVRLNPDSLRKIDVRSSRYSAQFGKGSGGLVDLQVQDGDNHFRVNATDFVPTFQIVKGIHLNSWTPRAYFSGPLVRDKLWFDISHEGETDNNIIKELPA
ncbi:MAG TPA: TonB-dependent receptor, partial [Candidatus Angelobacter sp.]